MKKYILIGLVLIVTVSMSAQNRFEKAASETVDRMKEVIKISEKQADQIYTLELESNIRKAEIRKENDGNQAKIQSEMKVINQENYKKTREIIGNLNMRDWSNYEKEQRAIKK